MQMEERVETLVGLVRKASAAQDLEVGREEARAIGEQIEREGGFALMKEVAERVRDAGRGRGLPFALGYIERWWNGIGRWMA